jgi:hypothetical protein
MACELCGRDMTTGDSCDVLSHTVDGQAHDPVPFGGEPAYHTVDADQACHDSGVRVGGFHHINCDTEWCPVEGRQVLGCDTCPEREAWWEEPNLQYRMAKARFMKGDDDDQKLAVFVQTVLVDPQATPAARRLTRDEISGIDYRAETIGGPRDDWSDLPG